MIRRILLCAVLVSVATLQLTVSPVAGGVSNENRTTYLVADLSGANERPGPGDLDAFGKAYVVVRDATNQVCLAMWWQNVDGTPSGLHIHIAPPTEPGPVVVPFAVPPPGTRHTYQCVTVNNEAVIDGLIANPQQYYVNLHSLPSFAPGAIRGQLRFG